MSPTSLPQDANTTPPSPPKQAGPTDQELLRILFDLGREVTAVLDLDELLQKVPQLISRLIEFQAFAVYLLDEKRGDLKIAYSVGYPPEVADTLRLNVGQGLVGTAVAEGRPLLVDDVLADPRYVETVAGTRSALVVPLRRKGRTLGALNLQSHTPGRFTHTDEEVLRQFAAAVSVGIENARLFEREKQHAETLETLAHIGREVASILDLDELLESIAQHVRCVISYRTFGILLINPETNELEMK
ncbi:MAG: GAF domain-containing protein, partial [Acidobacteria bacterium]|nr:GAF domain-containing protein [Acidobacteriota bacterium]